MEKVLYKKSYQLNSFAPKRYDDLLGKRGIFSTIRVIGKCLILKGFFNFNECYLPTLNFFFFSNIDLLLVT